MGDDEAQKIDVGPDLQWRVLVAKFRDLGLIWLGTVGLVIELFSRLKDIIEFADWARWIVLHWTEWANVFWRAILGWTGLRIPPDLSVLFTFGAASVSLLAGLRFSSTAPPRHSHTLQDKGFFLLSAIFLLAVLSVILYLPHYFPPEVKPESREIALLVGIGILCVPLASLLIRLFFGGLIDSQDRIGTAASVMLYLIFSAVILWPLRTNARPVFLGGIFFTLRDFR